MNTSIPDPRHITNGFEIPSEGYCDQPFVVKTDDGGWLCVMTTGPGHEGQSGQHVVAIRSTDRGRTWSPAVALEPSDGPEASYAVLLKTPFGRVYAFYNHNTDNVREVKADRAAFPDGLCRRVDSLGYYVFKYSDDHGRTWSEERYPIDVRPFAIDRENAYGGAMRFFWNVGKPIVRGDDAYMILHKVGGFGGGFFTRSEGVFLKSDNILIERDPRKIRFATLPDGEVGLRAPAGGGPIAEEQSAVVLSDGSMFCVYRTTDGHPACSESRDGGHTWSQPRYMTFTPGGRRFKHPRAANFIWKCANGKYLYWFHNHGGRSYEDRNPAWLCGGVERPTPEGMTLVWSQPEIALYDDDPLIRMSYPDLIEQDKRYYVTETQKQTARVHELDAMLLDGLWAQLEGRGEPATDAVVEVSQPCASVDMPAPPRFVQRDYDRRDFGARDMRAGVSLDMTVCLDALDAGQVLFDSQAESGAGVRITTGLNHTLHIALGDGQQVCTWRSDAHTLRAGVEQRATVIIDGGPRLILLVIDGVLCDGGAERPFGWGRFSPTLQHIGGRPTATLHPAVRALRIHARPLRVAEAIASAEQ